MSEEKDIVARLMEQAAYDAAHNPPYGRMMVEAASEITRLRDQVREAADGAQPLWSGEVAADKAEILRLRGEVERLTAEREGDASDAAERDVGRYLYNRLEALVYAGVKCPEMDWIARVIESVEEYGASHCGSDELAPFPALSSAPKPEEG
jgi:hypothetical protein